MDVAYKMEGEEKSNSSRVFPGAYRCSPRIFRISVGAAIPYALGYVPGPWMKGIQVSKGSASVKNGYESITGQINVDYLKPEDEQQVEVNLFGDTKSRIEANADANVHLSDKWSSGDIVAS